ncbi:MAG: NGG1p interacting factor NIF3 [Coxiellaceae bacterium]|nr:NGG1p interacting factor NIF3 [Coxiellaceae bacterium]
MFHIHCYVPKSHLHQVKDALFEAGAGRLGHYSQCCWETKGTGQFCPNDSAQSFTVKADTVTTIEEYKIELVCQTDKIDAARKALIESHPYETPAYGILPIST